MNTHLNISSINQFTNTSDPSHAIPFNQEPHFDLSLYLKPTRNFLNKLSSASVEASPGRHHHQQHPYLEQSSSMQQLAQLATAEDARGIGIGHSYYRDDGLVGGSNGISTSTFLPSFEQVASAVVQQVTLRLHGTNNGTIGISGNSTGTRSVVTTTTSTGGGSSANVFESQLIVPMYATIFLLSVVGNTLVLVTLIQNKRMRTVTNVYLLNLALSDLLLGVFCMPFTLVGQVLRNFIFGAAMCKLIPYFQAVAVSVGVWTLVAISLERYFAICRPLKSRRWQTQFHAYKMIVMVWLASLCWSAPVLLVSQLQSMKGRSGFKCREEWPTRSSEQAYNLFLDAMLLLVPLLVMGMAYSLIMTKLWKGLKREIKHNTSCQQQMFDRSNMSSTMLVKNNNTSMNGTPKSLNASYTPLSDKGTTLHQGNATKLSISKAESVKTWILSGMSKFCVTKPTVDNPYHEHNCKNRTNASSTGVADATDATLVTTTTVGPHHNHYANANSESRDTNTNLTYSSQYATGTTVCSNTVDVKEKEVVGVEVVEKQREETTYTFTRHTRHAIRSNYMEKSIEAKRKVIRMLFVIVAEFFICWAPLHILNTCYLFYPEAVYRHMGSTGISLIQLLAYISSCCNPITYCFMNRKFRQAFIAIFNCRRICCCFFVDKSHSVHCNLQRNGISKIVPNNSESGNDSTLYVGRASTIGRSEVLVLEAEDRV